MSQIVADYSKAKLSLMQDSDATMVIISRCPKYTDECTYQEGDISPVTTGSSDFIQVSIIKA